MASNHKFQAGETYKDDEQTESSASFFADPAKVVADIMKDLAGASKQAKPSDIIGLLKDLTAGGPLDDRKGTTELLIGILTALPPTSKARTHLTNKLLTKLWNSLDHPPLSYVGGDVKYEVVNQEEDPHKAKVYDTIEFKAPDSDITLREHVPQQPDGLFQYRMPDGSYNNILQPNLGRAGTPYAKSVRSLKRLQGVKPDPGLLFDLLMARDDDHFQENPAGVSTMFYYHAAIIIHDIFRTSRTDMNKSDTSSYLDLAPLYGSSLKDQLEIRTMKEGLLKPDTFHEKRLLGQPAGVNVMLVLYSRFHNYVADVLLKINENGRFTLACAPDASPEDRAKAVAKQDHDLFNTARLIVGGLYINISMHDYIRAITNSHHSDTTWTLDPRVDIDNGEGPPRGVGNQVSVEFNLLYRFHSCISKKDEAWINNFFLKLFPGTNPDDLQNVSWPELGQALVNFERSIPKDPSVRTFDGLERQEDGKFKDEDLVRILKEATEDPCGLFGARTIPKALKIVEVLAINQARKWQVGSLNEFREFFGLKRHETFNDINSNPDIANILEKLYSDPDMVELYPGLMIESAKPIRNTGCGIGPTYSLGRAVLSDAVTLVRSDRFNTLDYTVSNLTNWGYNEVKQDVKTMGGSMLYKLIQRGVPGWFPFNSLSVMQPMFTKVGNEKIAREIGTIDQFTLNDPKPPAPKLPLFTSAAIKQMLDNPKQFVVPWLPPIDAMFPGGKKDLSWFMLAADGPKNAEHRTAMKNAMSKVPDLRTAVREFIDREGRRLIEKETFKLKEGLEQIDLIRDVAIPLNAQLLSDLWYLDMRTDENPSGSLNAAEFYKHLLNIRDWAANNSDPAESWNRRRRAQESAAVIIPSTRKLVDDIKRPRGIIGTAVSDIRSSLKAGSLRSCGRKIVEEQLRQGTSAENVVDCAWLMAFGGIGVLVSVFYDVLNFFLKPENESIWAETQALAEKADYPNLRKYIQEAQRLTSTQRNPRVATAQVELEGKTIQPGTVVVAMLGEAGRNPKEVTNADKFDVNRTVEAVGSFGHGPHECFGQDIALTFVTGLVKLVADLKNLRPAPGQMGEVKLIRVGTERYYLNDSWSYLSFDPSTWKLHFDGHGKGSFKGEREPTKVLPMQQYYQALQKRKTGLFSRK